MGYRAFFSYARADDRVAAWLHRALDGYRAPKPLVGTAGELGPVPAKLHPIFRDRTDLEAGGHVDASLQAALEESETLVVLCTPTSAKSFWVNHECETFLRLGREGRIFPVIASGEPNSGLEETECFPPALRGKGLLAADLREIKLPSGQFVGDGREGGRLKLIAGLLGVPLDQLVQRERRRQRRLVASLSVAALAFAGLAAAAIGLGFAAKASEDRAYNSLARIFAERAWQQIEQKNYGLAARYLLAGYKSAPDNANEYRAALSALMHMTKDGSVVVPPTEDVERIVIAPGGRRILSLARGGVAGLWQSPEGRRIADLRKPGEKPNKNVIREGVFSPDGERFITIAPVRLWNATNGQEIAVLEGARNASFSADGAIIATISTKGVQLWDGRTGALRGALTGLDGSAASAVFSPDGRYIATTAMTPMDEPDTFTASIQVWDAANLKEIARIKAPGADYELQVAFSPDGARFVTSRNEAPRVYDTVAGKLVAVLKGHDGNVRSAQFSRDGRRILTAPYHGAARVWDAADGRLIAVMGERDRLDENAEARLAAERAFVATRDPHEFDGEVGEYISDEEWRNVEDSSFPAGRVAARTATNIWDMDSAVFSPDEALVLTYGQNNIARLWDANTGKQVAALTHDDWVRSVTFSRDGSRILTASLDNTVRLWDGRTGDARAVLLGHQAGVDEAVFANNDIDALSVSSDGSVRSWPSVGVGDVVIKNGDDGFSLAAFGHDGARILTAGSVNTGKEKRGADIYNVISWVTYVWSAAGKPLGELRRPGVHADVAVRAVSPVAPLFLSYEKDIAQIWDFARAAPVATLDTGGASVRSGTFSADGSKVALGLDRGDVLVFDAASGRVLARWRRHFSVVNSVAFSPDGRLVLSASDDSSAQVNDIASGRQTLLLPHDANVYLARFNADGSRIVTAFNGPKVQWEMEGAVWDAKDGKRVNTAVPHVQGFNKVAFSPDARLMLIVDKDTVHMWNFARGAEIAALHHLQTIKTVEFSKDGRLIATASDDETARIWDVATGRQLAELRHGNRVERASFSPKGDRLVTLSDFGTARTWNIARLVQPMDTLAQSACKLMDDASKQFSASEIGGDPLIRDVWVTHGRTERSSVCQ